MPIPYLKGLPVSTFNNFYNKLPFTGRSDYFGSVSSMQNFGPALVIKMVPFRDMSIEYPYKESDFDKLIQNIQLNLPKGTGVTAIVMNTSMKQKGGKMVSGKVSRIEFDFENENVQIFVIDNKTGNEFEIYPETIFREMEKQVISAPATPELFN